jgi:hypothetical protein
LQPYLTGQEKPLIRGQLSCKGLDAPKFLAQENQLLELSARVNELERFLSEAVERNGGLDCGLNRAAARERPSSVVHPGQESLLERVRRVGSARETPAATSVRDQLERGLAVAVLQILRSQPVTVDAQQDPTLGVCDLGHELGLVEEAQSGECAVRLRGCSMCLRLRSGRHMCMSHATACRPPSQFAPSPRAASR